MGPPPIQNFFVLGLGAEIMYSFIIIVCSLMIYFGTRELYALSSHKGIKYFRQAFLFFAIACFFRTFIRFILFYFNSRELLDISPRIFGGFTMFIFMYFSSMAIFYLVYSIMWKKWNNNPKIIYGFHALAIIAALISIITRDSMTRFILGALMLAFVLFLVYRAHLYSKKKDSMYFIYVLLFVFLVLNIIDILIPPFLETFKLLIYLFSTGVFLSILYKVLKKVGN